MATLTFTPPAPPTITPPTIPSVTIPSVTIPSVTVPSHTVTPVSPSCVTATPGRYGHVPMDACNSYYNFDPQFGAAVAVTVIFGTLMVAHLALAILHKKRYCWVVIMGATWEFLAFVFGALGAHDQQNQGWAIAHQLLFLLAPLWINAFVYMTFAREVHFFMPNKKIWKIRGARLGLIFILADVVAFLVQAVGGLMASPGASAETVKIGVDVYMGGIGLQEFFILCFIGLMVYFQRSLAALERSNGPTRDRSWRPLHYTLYGVLVAISVRIIYRIAEYAGGIKPSNPVPFHEAYSYVLDAFPMMVALLLLAIVHPGTTLVGPDSQFPSRKEKKAAKKERKAAKLAAKRDERYGGYSMRSQHAREASEVELV